MHIEDPLIKIDVYTAVYSESLGRGLKSGEQDVEVPESEAKPWLGNYALLSSEREEDESRPTKTPRRNPAKKRNKHTRTSDGDVVD